MDRRGAVGFIHQELNIAVIAQESPAEFHIIQLAVSIGRNNQTVIVISRGLTALVAEHDGFSRNAGEEVGKVSCSVGIVERFFRSGIIID
ncbi:hypothetical protein DSECCO2_296470 [anaerobic digester metagenome]